MGWLVLGIAIGLFLFLTLLIENEKWGWATLSLLLTGVVYSWLNRTDVFSWFGQHWVEAVVITGIYLVVGIVWSFIKWFSFLIGFRDKLREAKEEYAKLVTQPGTNPPDLKSWLQGKGGYWYKHHYYGNALTQVPQASDNKGRIVAWMSFWPFSMVGTVINDPVRRLFNFLFNQLKATYQRLANYVFRNEGLN